MSYPLVLLGHHDGCMDRLKVPHRVDEPWGHELRFAQTDRYAGRLLHLNAGHRLEPRYHTRKDATSYLLSGRLVLMQGRSIDSLATWEVEPGTAWRNEPGVVHSIEALEPAVVLEVSTPDVDDMVRLSDLYGRVVTD